MKAVVFTDFGLPQDALVVKDVEMPIPEDNQVLVKVKASSLTVMEGHLFTDIINGREMDPFMRHMYTEVKIAHDRIMGMDVSGVVEETGKGIKHVKKGDEVFGFTNDWFGAWAEFACLNEDEVALKPSNLSFEEAGALAEAGTAALGAIRAANVQPGHSILVYGSTGGVGLLSLQFAKALGGVVTGVCATCNVDLVREAGADFVINFEKEDFTQNEEEYDTVLVHNGYNPAESYIKVCKPGGLVVFVGGNNQQLDEFRNLWPEKFKDSGKRLTSVSFNNNERELPFIAELAEADKIKVFLDKVYPVREVAAAITDKVEIQAHGKMGIKIDF